MTLTHNEQKLIECIRNAEKPVAAMAKVVEIITEFLTEQGGGGLMPYYRPCPLCGAALDPGERCDCQDEENRPRCYQHRERPGGKRFADQLFHLQYKLN